MDGDKGAEPTDAEVREQRVMVRSIEGVIFEIESYRPHYQQFRQTEADVLQAQYSLMSLQAQRGEVVADYIWALGAAQVLAQMGATMTMTVWGPGGTDPSG